MRIRREGGGKGFTPSIRWRRPRRRGSKGGEKKGGRERRARKLSLHSHSYVLIIGSEGGKGDFERGKEGGGESWQSLIREGHRTKKGRMRGGRRRTTSLSCKAVIRKGGKEGECVRSACLLLFRGGELGEEKGRGAHSLSFFIP